MEIKNKENKYIYTVVIICIFIGFLIGVNTKTSNNTKSEVIETVSEKIIPPTQETTQTVNVNTKVEETKEKEIVKINVNTATEKELSILPGIGEVKANAIIKYRKENGSFASLSELVNVKGIGLATIEKLKEKAVID